MGHILRPFSKDLFIESYIAAIDFLAWNDGKIRAYTPESGKLKYTIHDAHNKGVTAVATTSDCTRIISGGGEGQVRVWNVGLHGSSYKMAGAMKEHKGIAKV